MLVLLSGVSPISFNRCILTTMSIHECMFLKGYQSPYHIMFLIMHVIMSYLNLLYYYIAKFPKKNGKNIDIYGRCELYPFQFTIFL